MSTSPVPRILPDLPPCSINSHSVANYLHALGILHVEQRQRSRASSESLGFSNSAKPSWLRMS
ncbi:hypothetical protein EYF80_005970 [Liparis tanakae]|uniref:Uncharacterized protein n=1 Tax=Liparis tanakae TaxID=230148 RepID=A0A4Z2J1T5_9TELE|nr:hypothetical protein EYF80_005970 [Liparis tanakae]